MVLNEWMNENEMKWIGFVLSEMMNNWMNDEMILNGWMNEWVFL